MTRRVLGREKVREGKAKIPLTVEEPDYENGEYPLNIKYLENDYYEGSDAFGKLLHVFKTFIHCPTIYVYKGIDEFARLTANLYSNNNLLNEGMGTFIVENISLGTDSIVSNGSTFYDYSLKKYEDTNQSFFPYGFNYFGVDEHYREPVSYDNARVIFVELGRNLIPVSIKTYPVMGAKGDTVKLVARVYKTKNGGSIDTPKDIPDNGYLKWYVNERYIGQTGFYESGYSQLNYTIIEDIGVYEYRVEYMPTDTRYNKGYGANTLCVLPQTPIRINAQANIPTSQLGGTCTFTIKLSSTECISGLRLYIDDQLVPLYGTSSSNNYTKNVTSKNVEVSFNIPATATSSKRWAVEGTHMVFWEYTDTCNGITHYQPLNTLKIMFPSKIDFDYIGRNIESPYDQIIYNTKKGIPIVTQEILGHVYNEKYPLKSVDDGILTLDIEKLVTYLSQSVQAEHVNPTVNLSHYEVDDYAVITSILYSNKDLPIPSRSLKFISTNPENTSTTVSKNTTISGATYRLLLNMAGTWKIQTKYNGNKYEYDTASTSKSITVYKKDTLLELSSSPTTVYVDDTVTFTGILTCNGTPLASLPVIFQYDNQNVNKTTDSEGKVTINKKFTQAGTSTIKLDFNETYKYNAATATKTITVKAKSLNTFLTCENQSGFVGDTISVPISILDENNTKPTIGTITIKEGNTTIKTLNVATDTLSFDRVLSQEGTKTYTLEYNDSTNKYKNSQSTVSITAERLNVTITYKNLTRNGIYIRAYDTGINDSDNFRITLKDEYGNPVRQGTLELLLHTTYDSYKDVTRQTSVKTIDIPSSGIVNLNAYELFPQNLQTYMEDRNFNKFVSYDITAKYNDVEQRYYSLEETSSAVYARFYVTSPTVELKVWTKTPQANDYSLIHNSSITEFGTGDISPPNALDVPANADIKVQFRILDSDNKNIGGVGYHSWVKNENEMIIYSQYSETTDEHEEGEFILTSNGNKIPYRDAKRKLVVETITYDEEGNAIVTRTEEDTPVLMSPNYPCLAIPVSTLFYEENMKEITSYNENNIITFRLPEEAHGISTFSICLTYFASLILGVLENHIVHPYGSLRDGLNDAHEFNTPVTHRYGAFMDIKFNSP